MVERDAVSRVFIVPGVASLDVTPVFAPGVAGRATMETVNMASDAPLRGEELAAHVQTLINISGVQRGLSLLCHKLKGDKEGLECVALAITTFRELREQAPYLDTAVPALLSFYTQSIEAFGGKVRHLEASFTDLRDRVEKDPQRDIKRLDATLKKVQQQVERINRKALPDSGRRIASSPTISGMDVRLYAAISEFTFSSRTTHCLLCAGIIYVGDLTERTKDEMLKIPNFGIISLSEVEERLSDMGLKFGMIQSGWKRPTERAELPPYWSTPVLEAAQ